MKNIGEAFKNAMRNSKQIVRKIFGAIKNALPYGKRVVKSIGGVIKNTVHNRKRMIWVAVIGTALLLLITGGIEAYRILYAPQNLFNVSTMNPALLSTQNAAPVPTPVPDDTGAAGSTDATAAPTVAPTPKPTPGITEGKEILNIMLIGVDRRQNVNGGVIKNTNTSEGTDPHADVQMIVAVNFKEKRVDLISLLRDTFIHEPDLMPGIYKINSTFNIGGGYTDADAGFRKVCEGAEYMLGGIPVDYYYAVDFDALVKMVDAIGGVDFDIENRSYSPHKKAGMQHFDGKDVLWYVRNRKDGPQVHDPARVDRQKELLIALFNQLKNNGKLSMVPDLIGAANSGVFTNTNLEQTLALVNFAKSIDSKNIGMHTMMAKRNSGGGTIGFTWYFTDQPKRQELIRQIYGIDMPEQVHCTEKYALWLDNYGFTGMVFLKNAKRVMEYAEPRKAEFTEEQRQAYDALAADYAETQAAWDKASLAFTSGYTNLMIKAQRKMKTDASALAKLLGYKETLRWTYNGFANSWCRDTRINEVWVDFR